MQERWSGSTTFLWGARGALTTLGPGVGLVTLVLTSIGSPLGPEASAWLAVGLAVAVGLGGLVLDRFRLAARLLITVGLWTPLALVSGSWLAAPMPTFWLGVLALGGTGLAWLAPFRGGASVVQHTADGVSVALRWSAWVALGTALLVFLGDLTEGPGRLAATGAAAIAGGWTIDWIARHRDREQPRALLLSAGLVLAAVGVAASWGQPEWSVAAATLTPALAVLATPGAGRGWTYVVEHPARLLVTTFLTLIALGTALLALPFAASGIDIAVIDAAFTSVSAVCVTGLIVLDTPNAFSPAGEALLLVLIQLGGLGIMSFYTAALAAVGRRLSLRHERAVAAVMSVSDRGRLKDAMLRILGVTAVSELLGAMLLTWRFVVAGDGLGEAMWRGTFTAVSAFCNAGFALQTDSLVSHQGDPWVLHLVAILIVVGGLSPAVVVALPRLLRRRPVPMQARVIVAATAILLFGGFAGYLSFEWSASLEGLSPVDRLHNAWFQSVTLRTAGFNSVDLTATTGATQTMMIALMFIGGSPGGTAGGAKTTTAAVLVLAVVAALRHRMDAVAFGRRVEHASVYRAAAVFTLGVLSVLGALMALQLTQTMSLDVVVFETVSALGTVGLSLGGTGELDSVGKVVVMACMFAGRVGPLTLFLFLADRPPSISVARPREELDVG